MDIEKIRDSFINSLNYIHPSYLTSLSDYIKFEIRNFLSNFQKIFTTNYDLMLYWINMAKKLREDEGLLPKIPDNDGFGRGQPGDPYPDNLIWINSEKQNVYYLHGAFHVFENGYFYKLTSDSRSLIAKVTSKIKENIYPLIVFEGKSEQKKEKINKNSYLWYCYKQLESIKGSLFILGSSLNRHSDNHIREAIKQSKLDSVYVGLHDKDNKNNNALIEDIMSLKNEEMEVYFFFSEKITNWYYKEFNFFEETLCDEAL